jgi:replicative DNA helicase
MLNHQVDVVVVDYLQKLKYYGNDLRKSVSDAMSDLFSFGKDNNVAMIVVSQLRRTDKSEPELSDLKESGSIEECSDCVILLHRLSTTNIKERTKGWYKIAKNRQGPTSDAIELKFDTTSLRFIEENPPVEEDAGIDNTFKGDD